MEKQEIRSILMEIMTTSAPLMSAAMKAVQRIDADSPVAEKVAISVMRQATLEGDVSDDLKVKIERLLPQPVEEKRDTTLRFRVTENEANYVRIMAARETGGSVSDLVRKRLGL